MSRIVEILKYLYMSNSPIFVIANVIIILCLLTILLAIAINFVLYHKTAETKRKTVSPIETGTMLLYFVMYYLLMNLSFGRIAIHERAAEDLLIIIGTLLVLLGCIVNIAGRFTLKSNWANQVTIYRKQTLVTTGAYRLARHPLYASIIWMMVGGCFVYLSYLALLSIVVIFIPMMYYRARQEESLLEAEFAEYSSYKKQVWMFSPKLFKL